MDSAGGPSGAPLLLALRTARVLGFVVIALWFFPRTLDCTASIVLGVLSQRKAAKQGGSTLLGNVAWAGGLMFTIAEVVAFLTYPPV